MADTVLARLRASLDEFLQKAKAQVSDRGLDVLAESRAALLGSR